MKTRAWITLVGRYRRALQAHVALGDEASLQRAYELGRKALNLGLGVVDVARLHHDALVGVVAKSSTWVDERWVRAVETFLMEALSAFEVAHRGFRDACERLGRMNETLKEQHEELAVNVRKLAHEVAQRKNAQELLQESELKFRSVVESAQDGILTVDQRGRLVAVNPRAEQLFGYRRSEMIGKSFTCLISRSRRKAARALFHDLVARSGQEWLKRPLEAAGRHRDGSELALEITLAAWRTRAGLFFTAVVRDIRERKQTEAALRESRAHYMRLFQEARAMEENLRELSSRVLTVQEEERKHISRELHDEIGQALTAANVSIAMLRAHAAGDETFRAKVDTAQKLLEQSMDLVHRFSRELRPSMLDHLGPIAALQNYVKTFAERTGIAIELEGGIEAERLGAQQGTVLYRVAQESLTNVFKHAQATRVTVRLRQLRAAVAMEISDNGCAFSVPSAQAGSGRQPLGLLGMQERVRLVNGEFAIESVPKRGTTVRVQIPLSQSGQAPVAPGYMPTLNGNRTSNRISHEQDQSAPRR